MFKLFKKIVVQLENYINTYTTFDKIIGSNLIDFCSNYCNEFSNSNEIKNEIKKLNIENTQTKISNLQI